MAASASGSVHDEYSAKKRVGSPIAMLISIMDSWTVSGTRWYAMNVSPRAARVDDVGNYILSLHCINERLYKHACMSYRSSDTTVN